MTAFLALAVTTKVVDSIVQNSVEQAAGNLVWTIVVPASVAVLWSLVSSVVGLLLTAKFLNLATNVGVRDFELICIETLRSIAAVSLRIPLLIVPAVIEWLRLAPVPFVVLFDASYRRGETDALVAARKFFKKFPYRVILLTALTVFVTVSVSLIETVATGDVPPLWEAPERHIVATLALVASQFALNWFLLKTYLRLFTQLTGPHNSMSNTL